MQEVDHFVWRDPFATAQGIMDHDAEGARSRITALVTGRLPHSGPVIRSLSLLFEDYGGPTLSRIPDDRLADLETAVIRFIRDYITQ